MTTGNRGDAVRELADLEAIRALVHRYAPGSFTTITTDPIDPSASERRWIDSGKPVNDLHRSHS